MGQRREEPPAFHIHASRRGGAGRAGRCEQLGWALLADEEFSSAARRDAVCAPWPAFEALGDAGVRTTALVAFVTEGDNIPEAAQVRLCVCCVCVLWRQWPCQCSRTVPPVATPRALSHPSFRRQGGTCVWQPPA